MVQVNAWRQEEQTSAYSSHVMPSVDNIHMFSRLIATGIYAVMLSNAPRQRRTCRGA